MAADKLRSLIEATLQIFDMNATQREALRLYLRSNSGEQGDVSLRRIVPTLVGVIRSVSVDPRLQEAGLDGERLEMARRALQQWANEAIHGSAVTAQGRHFSIEIHDP